MDEYIGFIGLTWEQLVGAGRGWLYARAEGCNHHLICRGGLCTFCRRRRVVRPEGRAAAGCGFNPMPYELRDKLYKGCVECGGYLIEEKRE